MVLATHAMVGAAVANLIPTHPVLGFFAAFASHLIVDAIPHWHYQLASAMEDAEDPMNTDMRINKDFLLDLLRIGSDAMIGVTGAILLLGVTPPYIFSATFVGAVGGMLPDALQFLYWKWRHEPLVSLQRFHLWIHARTDLDDKPILGPALQIGLALLCVLLVKFFFH